MRHNKMRQGRIYEIIAASLLFSATTVFAAAPVETANGQVEGTSSADAKVRIFKGIPFAAPPVGDLRWKAPQPPANWSGVRKATQFGARCMQARIYSDMVFRDSGPSEDCLYLNVWTPAAEAGAKLPVMVWIYGGGFAAGATSEPRQDGEHLAEKGVIVVSANYRLGIFGFFAHKELAKESGNDSAGNYGLLDQVAALEWVHKNIGAFGGDPGNVTIFGESAGSFSVSALMASPLTQGLFQRAIGESGAFFGRTLQAKTVKQSEEADEKFAKTIGAPTLTALRAKSASDLLQAARREKELRFVPNIDGYFLPEDVYSIYAAGKQRHVPLLAGWNADEGSYKSIFEKESPTLQNYVARIHALYGDNAGAILKAYEASNDVQAKRAAQDLAGDRFIGYSTWKWIEMQNATGDSPVYRYRFEDAPPPDPADPESASNGAYHSAEIEFVFGALASKHLPWRAEDRKLSDIMSTYWSNFAKNGNPNGNDLAQWPVYTKDSGYHIMHLVAEPHAGPDAERARYETLDSVTSYPTESK
jgi:para-nitrobenzyl esterase